MTRHLDQRLNRLEVDAGISESGEVTNIRLFPGETCEQAIEIAHAEGIKLRGTVGLIKQFFATRAERKEFWNLTPEEQEKKRGENMEVRQGRSPKARADDYAEWQEKWKSWKVLPPGASACGVFVFVGPQQVKEILKRSAAKLAQSENNKCSECGK